MTEPSYLVEHADAVTLVNVAEGSGPRWLLLYVVEGEGVARYLADDDLPVDVDRVDAVAVTGHVQAVLGEHYTLATMKPTGEEAAAWILHSLDHGGAGGPG